jgi:hypothetical protein
MESNGHVAGGRQLRLSAKELALLPNSRELSNGLVKKSKQISQIYYNADTNQKQTQQV